MKSYWIVFPWWNQWWNQPGAIVIEVEVSLS